MCAAVFILALATLLTIENRVQFFVEFALMIVAVCLMNFNERPETYLFLVFIVLMTNKSAKVVLKIFTLSAAMILFVCFALVWLNLIPDLVYYNGTDLLNGRLSLGIIYPTDAASVITYMLATLFVVILSSCCFIHKYRCLQACHQMEDRRNRV